jgi:arylsulfatase A-like enzyme
MYQPFYDGNEYAMADNQVVQNAIGFLNQNHTKPFFLAVGLYRPHLPWLVPKRYFDMHPLNEIRLPALPTGDLLDLSAAAIALAAPNQDHKRIVDSDTWKQTVQGYLASVSYADDCLGRLVSALEASVHRSNTVVVLWSDHGWHLGEKLGWRKFKLWERALRVPLIVAMPQENNARSIYEPVSLMDLLPTITDICTGQASASQNGKSLMPLIRKESLVAEKPVVSSWFVNGHHLSARSKRFRYIKYTDASEELYDHFNDPGENVNLLKLSGSSSNYSSIVAELRAAAEGAL